MRVKRGNSSELEQLGLLPVVSGIAYRINSVKQSTTNGANGSYQSGRRMPSSNTEAFGGPIGVLVGSR
jgi:hypothetical protein